MKKFLLVLIVIAALITSAGFVIYNTRAGQDAVFQRLATAAMTRPVPTIEGLQVIVCGSASPLGNDASRAQACIAVVTPEHFVLFDLGARSPLRINQARLPIGRLDAVFLTHFHSDHIAGLADVNLASWIRGRTERLKVFGATGVADVVAGFNQAYAMDQRYRTAHHGEKLLPPAAGPMLARTIIPGETAWETGALKVTSFSVDHSPVSPAVGYRVDYRGRSVVISGDTNATDGLFAAAQGADLLFHDALSRPLLDPMIAAAVEAKLPVMPQIMTDVIDYHADSTTIETQAAAAGVKQLALYHLVPVPVNALAMKLFRRGLAKSTLVVDDLQRFELPVGSQEIRVIEP